MSSGACAVKIEREALISILCGGTIGNNMPSNFDFIRQLVFNGRIECVDPDTQVKIAVPLPPIMSDVQPTSVNDADDGGERRGSVNETTISTSHAQARAERTHARAGTQRTPTQEPLEVHVLYPWLQREVSRSKRATVRRAIVDTT